MKILKHKSWTFMVFWMIFSTASFGWFEEFKQSVRGRGMTNLQGSTFQGITSMYYNPATIAHARTFEFMTSFSAPAGGFTSFDDGSSIQQLEFAAMTPFVNPVNLKKAGWRGDVITTKAAIGLSFIQQSYDSGDGTAGVAQRYVGVTYAKNLDNILFQGARLSFGITNNIYMLSFEGTDVANNAAFSNTSKTTWSPDIGVLYNFSDFILISLVMENLVPTSISPFENGETLPSNTKLGLAWEFGDIGKLPFLQDILIAAEWRIYSPADQGQGGNTSISSTKSYHLGWESWYKPHKKVAVAYRLGFGVGDNSYSEVTSGVGVGYYIDKKRKTRFDVDFSWVWSSFASSLGSDHRYYVGGVFKYFFPETAFPDARKKITLDKSLSEESQEKKQPAKTPVNNGRRAPVRTR